MSRIKEPKAPGSRKDPGGLRSLFPGDLEPSSSSSSSSNLQFEKKIRKIGSKAHWGFGALRVQGPEEDEEDSGAKSAGIPKGTRGLWASFSLQRGRHRGHHKPRSRHLRVCHGQACRPPPEGLGPTCRASVHGPDEGWPKGPIRPTGPTGPAWS